MWWLFAVDFAGGLVLFVVVVFWWLGFYGFDVGVDGSVTRGGVVCFWRSFVLVGLVVFGALVLCVDLHFAVRSVAFKYYDVAGTLCCVLKLLVDLVLVWSFASLWCWFRLRVLAVDCVFCVWWGRCACGLWISIAIAWDWLFGSCLVGLCGFLCCGLC